METAFTSLEQLKPNPENISIYGLDKPIIAGLNEQQPSQAKPLNPEYVPQQIRDLETELSKQGSGTSGLATALSILAAAKGDFRGLLQIEESKRKTALAKDIVPKMRIVNELVDTGDFKGAGKYLDAVVGSYGNRAENLAPYFTQMANNIRDRQKRYEEVKATVGWYDENVPLEHPNRPVVDTLKKSIARGELPSQEGINNFFNRMQPHIQQIGREVNVTSPITSQVQRITLPEVATAKDLDTFAGHTIAGANNITVEQLSDLLRGIEITDSGGKVITPNSPDAIRIRQEYTAMGPIQAKEKIARMLQLDPAITLQTIKEFGTVRTALKDFGASDERVNAIERVLQGQMDRITEQKRAEITAVTESDINAPQSQGLVTVIGDKSSRNWLQATQPATYGQVRQSKGQLLHINKDIHENIVLPSIRAKEDLNLINDMFTGDLTPYSSLDRLSTGLNQTISSYLGFPVTKQVEIRQAAKAILNSAVEQVENVVKYQGKDISGRDRQDIADLKRYASGDFRTAQEYIDAANRIKTRIDRIIDRVTESLPQIPEQQNAPSRQGRPRNNRPIEQTDERGVPMPYTVGPSTLTPEQQQQVDESRRERGLPPIYTDQPTQSTPAPALPTQQSTPGSAEDRIKKAWPTRK